MSEATKRGRTVRSRMVMSAVVVVGVTLLVASVGMVVALRRSLTHNVRDGALQVARPVVAQLEEGIAAPTIPFADDDDEFVQIVNPAGAVVAESETLSGESRALVDLAPGESASVKVTFDDDPFLVVALAADTGDGRLTVLAGRTLDNVVESTAIVTGLLAIGMPVLLLLVATLTWRFTGQALAPVETIRAEVESISASELHRRVSVPESGDEIARLAGTMNTMLDRLEEAQKRERRLVSDASHELRSPVAAIRQHVEVALAHPDRSSIPALAESVLAEDLRLQRLVDDLLLLARVGEGAGTGTVVDLDDVVLEEAGRRRGATSKDIDQSGVSGGRVRGDAKQLTRMVANLLENAERHASSGIWVALSEIGDEVVLTVDDDGPGIPTDERERVFQRFVRLDEARGRDSGGAGLGLAIVAEVGRFHRGTARALDSPRGGARIEVRLPRAE